MMDIFGARNVGVLEKSLDSLNKNHEAISNNIANADTPGYKRNFVTFKEELSNLLNNSNDLTITNKKHISINGKNINSFRAKVQTEENTIIRNDKNNVSIDAEMAALAKNTLEYQAVTKQISNQFRRLGSVIQKGGR